MPALLLLLALATPSQDKKPPYTKADRIKHLEDEIASLEKTLAAARAELRRLKPAASANVEQLRPAELELGQVGPLEPVGWAEGQNWKVREILGNAEMIVYHHRLSSVPLILKGKSTRGLADGRWVGLDGLWKVETTRKLSGRTYYVLEKVDK